MLRVPERMFTLTGHIASVSAMPVAPPLGTFGLLKGRGGRHSLRERAHSFVPMGMMAGGDLGVIIASRYGPISFVTPLTGAYPVVTLVFAALVLKERIRYLQGACIAAIILGMLGCSQ